MPVYRKGCERERRGGCNVQPRMAQLPTPHHPTRTSQRHTRTGKNTPSPSSPPRQITQHPIPPFRRELISPKVLTPRIRHGGRQLAQAHTHTDGDQTQKDDAVDDEDRPPTVDARD